MIHRFRNELTAGPVNDETLIRTITTLPAFTSHCALHRQWKREFLTMFGRLKKLSRLLP